MTWGAQITKPDGTIPEVEGKPQYHACATCLHGKSDFKTGSPNWPTITPCYIPKAANTIGSLLTSLDIGADGHMACGSAKLMCSGYEEIPVEVK